CVCVPKRPSAPWWVGKASLPIGTHNFRITAAGVAFIDIAQPHHDDFTRIVVATNGIAGTGGYTATSADWHPIRIGWASTSGPTLQVSVALSGATTYANLTRSRMRGRAEGTRGLMQHIFEHQVPVAN